LSNPRFKRQAGQRTGGVPYGSAVDPDGPRNKQGRPVGLRPVPAEQAGLDRLAALAATGGSLRGIAAGLDAAGFPAKKGGRWSAAAVARVLKRPEVRARVEQVRGKGVGDGGAGEVGETGPGTGAGPDDLGAVA
jgi:hypothetical protein